ncbi:MAG: methyltransferase domain-containing protein [bacterium]|nr:methyltransferase domain-containing protein [bacterium]
MIRLLQSLLNRIYNEKFESLCARILYFFNTIDTYFLVAGITAFLLVWPEPVRPGLLAGTMAVAIITSKIADFYPHFGIALLPVMFVLWLALPIPFVLVLKLLGINILIFIVIQFLFMGIPDSIVARDPRVAFIKLYNSFWTVAPTTVSFAMSVCFSIYLSFSLMAAAAATTPGHVNWLSVAGAVLLLSALATRLVLPRNHYSKFHKPDTPEKAPFQRLIILNIDGARKDIFDSLDLPAVAMLKEKGSWHPQGLETVYRALTNPAFASIFTGTVPAVHGVRSNNFGQSIMTEGLPDLVPAIAYGSMHVKHFCKPYWQTRIVSLPSHSVYRSDDIMVDWLKDDLQNRPEVRLFVADFSEADFLAHAYGSTAVQYKEALQRIDGRIGEFLKWLEAAELPGDTAIMVCSDHGIAAIDHSYLLAESEKFVPFILYGPGIKAGHQIKTPGTIMDICCTAAYLLGIPYPASARGQVFTEALEAMDHPALQEELAGRFNQIKYDTEARSYQQTHTEITVGDAVWWDRCIAEHCPSDQKPLRVLDVGCGSGFVGQRFVKAGVALSEFVCFDISDEMLNEARSHLGQHETFTFSSDLNTINGPFDLITISSVFHHVPFPKHLADRLDRLLATEGILIGSHEPNRRVFESRGYRLAALAYKNLGGGITIPAERAQDFNHELKHRYPLAPHVCREEILQMTEYHSPLEQYEHDIDCRAGFSPEDFLAEHFAGYDTRSLETYTTFFCRPALMHFGLLQKLMHGIYQLFFHQGNLFRFVLQKPVPVENPLAETTT